MTPVIESFRYAVMGVGSFQPMHLVYSGAMAVGILFLGTVLFHRVERTFMDTI
jgi:lipopolysaccharide transport system permease protein